MAETISFKLAIVLWLVDGLWARFLLSHLGLTTYRKEVVRLDTTRRMHVEYYGERAYHCLLTILS